MRRRNGSIISILCAICLICSLLCGFSVPADISGAALTSGGAYAEIVIYIDGINETFGYVVNKSVAYMSVEEFSRALELGCTISEESDRWMFCATLGNVELFVSSDGKYMTANGRCFYLPDGVYVIDGDYCLPVAELAGLFSATVQWDTATESIDINATHLGALESGDDYYNKEDLKWLSQIINAESGNQSLEGMMGVGNVVLNRVADPACPDTVYGVIFDTRYGVQFSPVENGTIYNTPSEQAVAAAKICLEGYNIVESSLYFVNPETGSTAWFRNTRTFVLTIGDHDFYA